MRGRESAPIPSQGCNIKHPLAYLSARLPGKTPNTRHCRESGWICLLPGKSNLDLVDHYTTYGSNGSADNNNGSQQRLTGPAIATRSRPT